MSQPMHFAAPTPQATRVLDAALACIGRVGLTKTTLDDVAREAGCARATVYRCFPNKQQLLVALVAREAQALRDAVVAASVLDATLADAITTVVTTAARSLVENRALAFLARHEPEAILPFLAFEREDAVLSTAAELVAPAFARFVSESDADRLGEWLARLTLSYLFSPSENFDIADPEHVRVLVDDFIVPGFVNVEGVSQ